MVAPRTDTPCLAAWAMAFVSACVVRMQCWLSVPSVLCTLCIKCPASSQCDSPTGAPTYPVDIIRLSFTTTHPLFPLSQVALFPTSCARCIKYSSQPGLFLSSFDFHCVISLSTLFFSSSSAPSLFIVMSAMLITVLTCCLAGSVLSASCASFCLNSSKVSSSSPRFDVVRLASIRCHLIFCEVVTLMSAKFGFVLSTSTSVGFRMLVTT